MVKLALLWHMHQPWYVHPETGRFELPWVRTHALKDYFGMAKLLEEFPGIKVTFNLVPSLLKQIELYLEGKKDRYQELFEKDPAEMTPKEKRFLAERFFSVNVENHIHPFPAYTALHRKMTGAGGEEFNGDWGEIFSDAELLDLQVWFSLSNIDQYYREGDERVNRLIRKGAGFSPEDKNTVMEIEREIMGKVIPLYRKLWEKGNIEISTTPYYHPILPLLIDPQAGRTADPSLPEYPLHFNWEADAGSQVARGLEYMESLFGRRPSGIWPSEGSLSEEVLSLLEEQGVGWTATDEKNLEKSLAAAGAGAEQVGAAKFRPWTFGKGSMKIFFRDNYLSDLIGFHYKNWNPGDAAADLSRKIESMGEGRKEDIVLPVILDGENAWEFYRDSGREFLREFYSAMEKSGKVDMITFSDAGAMPPGNLKHFSPGSWINGNFNIWIGHEDDRRGWSLIELVKELVGETPDPEVREKIHIAQGSDWFWWYGTENHTEDLDTFDRLFRENLTKACTLAGIEPPRELGFPVFRKRESRKTGIRDPQRYLTPVIDGRETTVYEWDGAGEIETGNMASAIYIAHPVFRKIKYAFDRDNLYLNISLKNEAAVYPSQGFTFELEIKNGDSSISVDLEPGSGGPECAYGTLLECAIPFPVFNGAEGDRIGIQFTVKKDGQPHSSFPGEKCLGIRIPSERDYGSNWVL